MTLRGLRLAIAAVALLGLAVATYLTVVHYAGLKIVCASGGGGCEKVQSSPQSELAGVPVAVLGLVGYLLIATSAFVRREAARLAGAVLALGGFGFSAYLTYEEVFSINAICQWCVGSAVLMTILAVLTCTRLLTEAPDDRIAAGGDVLEDAERSWTRPSTPSPAAVSSPSGSPPQAPGR